MRVPRRSRKQLARKSCRSWILNLPVSPCAIFQFSNAGPKTVDVLSRWRMCTRVIRRRAREISVSTGCKFMTSALPRCTGKSTRSVRATGNAIMNEASACRLRLLWAAIPSIHSRRLRRCRMAWMSCFLLVSCEKNQSNSFAAKRSMSMSRRTSILFWKVTSSRVRCVRKAHLAITPGFTPRSKTTQFSI